MKSKIQINRSVARRVLAVVDQGLVAGLGKAEPGKMCVEAAVNYALGLPHGDSPSCVGGAVRDFKIRLNDAPWSSDAARTAGLRALAIAQLGSNSIDQQQFHRLLAFKGITQIVPVFMRKFATKYAAQISDRDMKKFKELTAAFETASSEKQVEALLKYYQGFGVGAGGAGGVGGFGFGIGFGDARGGGFGVGFGVGFGFGFGVGFGVVEFKEFFGNDFLNRLSAVGLECLKELKSPGCKYLDLLES